MTQPIGSGYSRAYDYDAWPHTDGGDRTASDHAASSPAGRAARDMCMHADTVVEGFLCGESTVTSNACRSPKKDVDAFVCDDAKMKEVQDGAWEATKTTAKLILAAIFGGMARK